MGEVPEFWHVHCTRMNDRGYYVSDGLIARDEAEARSMASAESMRCSHTTVTNHRGMVATYVGGQEWRGSGDA
jgi:hypothetical protein